MTEQLNYIVQLINDAHARHYIDNENGLVDVSSTSSPNKNLIYHLYSNGEITYQKGSWAYLQRSEFSLMSEIPMLNKDIFKLPKTTIPYDNYLTYAILTEEECKMFRKKMEQYVKDNCLGK